MKFMSRDKSLKRIVIVLSTFANSVIIFMHVSIYLYLIVIKDLKALVPSNASGYCSSINQSINQSIKSNDNRS